MQQNCCDQGLSCAVLIMTCPTFFARTCCGWEEIEECVDFTIDEKLHRSLPIPCHDPFDIVLRIHPYIRHHAGDVDMLRVSECDDCHTLSLQIPNRPTRTLAKSS